jgi:hypothetical protein
MPFIPATNCAKVDFLQTQTGQRISNTLWFQYTHPLTTTDLSDLADAMETWWTASMAPNLRGSLALQEIDVTDMSSQSGAKFVKIINPPVPGTVSGTDEPNHTAAAATFRTEKRGRSYRGRNYLGGIAVTKTTDSVTLLDAWVSAVISAFTAVTPALSGLDAVWVVVSHYLNKVARSTAHAEPITAVSMDTSIDSQRRRLKGRGRI